MEKITTLEAE